jgi:hypothetical protein
VMRINNVAMCIMTPGSFFCGYQHVEKLIIVTFNVEYGNSKIVFLLNVGKILPDKTVS